MPLTAEQLHLHVYNQPRIVGSRILLTSAFNIKDSECIFTEGDAAAPAVVLAADLGTLLVRLEGVEEPVWLIDDWHTNHIVVEASKSSRREPGPWDIVVSSQGDVGFYPLDPPVPPHKVDQWEAGWFREALSQLDLGGPPFSQTMRDAYWDEDYVVSEPRPEKPMLDALFLKTRGPTSRVFRCSEAVAAAVHKALRCSVRADISAPEGVRQLSLNRECAVVPHFDDIEPWDAARVLRLTVTSYIPSVLEISSMVQQEEAGRFAQSIVFKKFGHLPSVVLQMLRDLLRSAWMPPATEAWPWITDQRLFRQSVADLDECGTLLGVLYSRCVYDIAGQYLLFPKIHLGFID
jgi:hypothetical protein